MTPAYDRDGITVYHGDALDVLPTIEADAVDCVVTSPPYNQLGTANRPHDSLGMHGRRGAKAVNQWVEKAADGYADQRDEGEYQDWLRQVMGECLRVARGLVWVNHKVRYRDGEAIHPARMLPFPIWSEVIWDRGGSMALNCRRFAPSHETLLEFGTPHWWNVAANTAMSVWRIAPQRSRSHPCPFPLELARRLVESSCPPGGVVLEPFGGEGTTARACLKSGRRCILVEKDARYIPTIIARLAAARTPLFDGLEEAVK
jgi:DNA modification methylase